MPRRLGSLANNNRGSAHDNGTEAIEQINNVVNMSHISRPLPPAPSNSSLEKVDESISDQEAGDTSDDEDELESDPEKDSESEISEKETSEDEEMVNNVKSPEGFDANASLPPIPNGTFDINSDKQMSSSEGEM